MIHERLHGRAQNLRRRWWLAALAATLAIAACGGSAALDQAQTIDLTLLAFNDFHGNLQPPDLTVAANRPDGSSVAVPAGGVAYLATLVADLRARNPNTTVVAAGDLVGASPMVSSLFLDEPSIDALNLLGLEYSATGNHEYDQGWQELLRLQNGGCERYTTKAPCQFAPDFRGARFQYLAANTVRRDGKPLLPATAIKFFEQDGVRIGVGFIGLVLKDTPHMVRPSGVQGLDFLDEAASANALIKPLRAQGADVIVVLIHQGGATTSALQDDSCQGLTGAIVPILNALSDQVDVVVSGHTHRSYLCDYARVNPAKHFLLTSAGLYGTLLTEIHLDVDRASRRVVRHRARQHIAQGAAFERGGELVPLQPAFPIYAAEPQTSALVAQAQAEVAPIAATVVGRLAGAATRTLEANGESVLGRIVADATLAAMRAPANGSAQIAFLNSGGIRADLLPAADGTVTYGQVYAVQPFDNSLMTLTLSGAELHALLEQQFASGTNTIEHPRILQVSRGFSYAYDRTAALGERISTLALDGVPITPQRDYRIAVQSYLAAGGDNFSVFTRGRDIVGGGMDVDALADYLRTASVNAPLPLPLAPRIQGK